MRHGFLLGLVFLLALSGCGAVEADSDGDPQSTLDPDPGHTEVTVAGQGLKMVDDDAYLYLASRDTIYRLAKPNGTPEIVAQDTRVDAISLAVDGTHLYWTKIGGHARDGVILRVAKAGGTPEVVASKRARPRSVAVDATNVYWTEDNDREHVEGERDGYVMAQAKSGGSAPIVLTRDARPDLVIAEDASHVLYVAMAETHTPSKIQRVAIAENAEPETLAERHPSIMGLSSDHAGTLTWSENPACSTCGGVWRRSPDGALHELASLYVSLGVATANGTSYFGRADEHGGAIFVADDAGPRELRATRGAERSGWFAGSVVVDAQRVYWFDQRLTPAHKLETVVRSALR